MKDKKIYEYRILKDLWWCRCFFFWRPPSSSICTGECLCFAKPNWALVYSIMYTALMRTARLFLARPCTLFHLQPRPRRIHTFSQKTLKDPVNDALFYTLVFLCKLTPQIRFDNYCGMSYCCKLGLLYDIYYWIGWTLLMMFKVETANTILHMYRCFKLFFEDAFNFGRILYSLDIKPIKIFAQRHLLYSFGADVSARFFKVSADFNIRRVKCREWSSTCQKYNHAVIIFFKLSTKEC